MNEELLRAAWDKVRNCEELTDEENDIIRRSERAKAVKSGAVFV